MEKRILSIIFILFMFFIVNSVNAIEAHMSDASSPFVINIGNYSQNYTIQISVTVPSGQLNSTNITYYMPYGIENLTPCTGPSSFSRVNTTTVACEISYGDITGTLEANFTFVANISAFTTYGQKTINISLVANETTNSTLKTISAQNFWKNPRPDAFRMSQSNTTLFFTNWNQTDNLYRVNVPIFRHDDATNRPVVANNTFGDIVYFDRSVFEFPTYMRLWTYNLSFKLVFDGDPNNQSAVFIIRSPINNSMHPEQTLIPILVRMNEETDPIANITRNITIGTPAQEGFNIFFNNTNYTQQTLYDAYGVNITFSPQDESAMMFMINATNMSKVNNTEFYILLTMANLSGNSITMTSPIFVNSQILSGFSPNTPPKSGQTINISMILNLTNRLRNYTLNNLRVSFMQPINVTMNISGTRRQFNTTQNISLSWWNGTDWATTGIITTYSNVSFVEHMPGPVHGANITLSVGMYEIDLSNSSLSSFFNNWEYNATILLNFSAVMTFPVLGESDIPSGSTGTHNYNATLSVPMQAPLNLTSKVPGLNSSATNVVVMLDGQQLSSENYTIGSLILNDVSSGTHVVTVTYTVPSSSSDGDNGNNQDVGGTTTTLANRTKYTYRYTEMAKGKVHKIKLIDKELGLKQILIEVKNKANNVKIEIVKLKGKPASIVHEISGKVYQYINITAENLNSTNIKSVKIRFNVTKKWMNENNFEKNEIHMYRYSNGEWQKLETEIISENTTHVEYEASSPGFSTFAIGGEKAEQAPQQPVCGNNVKEEGEECDGTDLGEATCQSLGYDSGTLKCVNCQFDTSECVKETAEKIEWPLTEIAIVIIILVILGILGWLHYHKHPQSKSF